MTTTESDGVKIIAALVDPVDGLLEPTLHRTLADGGAHRLQVNLDDAPVAAAMRFGPDPGAPVRAVVSVWASDAERVGALVDVLRGLDRDAARIWRVEEHVRLAPTPGAPGERIEALANVALLRRPASMPREEWLADWLDRHTAVAMETQATFGYVQNPVVEHLSDAGRDVAGIVEELFPMAGISDPHAFYGSGGDPAELDRRLTRLLESCARFGASDGLDLVATSRYDVPLD